MCVCVCVYLARTDAWEISVPYSHLTPYPTTHCITQKWKRSPYSSWV